MSEYWIGFLIGSVSTIFGAATMIKLMSGGGNNQIQIGGNNTSISDCDGHIKIRGQVKSLKVNGRGIDV